MLTKQCTPSWRRCRISLCSVARANRVIASVMWQAQMHRLQDTTPSAIVGCVYSVTGSDCAETVRCSARQPWLGFITAVCCIALTNLTIVGACVYSGSPLNLAELKITISLGTMFGVLGVLPTALVISISPPKYVIPGAILCVVLWPIGVTTVLSLLANVIANT